MATDIPAIAQEAYRAHLLVACMTTLPECTCGGRRTIQHLAGCPMGEALAAAPPEAEKIAAWRAEAEQLLGETMEGPYSVIIAIADAYFALATARAEAREEGRAELAGHIKVGWELRATIRTACDAREAAEASLAETRAEIERLKVRIDMSEAMVTQKSEQYIAERRAHDESRAEIAEAREAMPIVRRQDFFDASLLTCVRETVSQLFGWQSRAEAAETELAKLRAALERIRDYKGAFPASTINWLAREALSLSEGAQSETAAPSLRDAALEEIAEDRYPWKAAKIARAALEKK